MRRILAFTLLAAPLGAQATLTPSNGVLGSSLDYGLAADPGDAFVLIPSTTNGPTPLALLYPSDPRVLTVGLELLPLVTIGLLDGAGAGGVSFPLPLDASLHALAIHAQFLTVPGATTFVDDVSPQTSTKLQLPQTSVRTRGDLNSARGLPESRALSTGDVLVVGGTVCDPTLGPISSDTIELYRAATQTFELGTATLSAPRTHVELETLTDGRVLIVGGANVGLSGTAQTACDLFDPSTETVTATGSLGTPRVGHQATLLADGRVLVSGGQSALGTNAFGPPAVVVTFLASTEVWNPATGKWTPGPTMPTAKSAHRASLLPDGRVLVVAGFDGTGVGSNVYAIDVTAGTVTAVAPLPSSRFGHTQSALSDGRILAVGGISGVGFNAMADVQRYDPTTDAWTTLPPLAGARGYCGLVQLPSGDVVVIGGVSAIDPFLATSTPQLLVERATPGAAWASAGSMIAGGPILDSLAVDGARRILTIASAVGGCAEVGDDAELYAP